MCVEQPQSSEFAGAKVEVQMLAEIHKTLVEAEPDCGMLGRSDFFQVRDTQITGAAKNARQFSEFPTADL